MNFSFEEFPLLEEKKDKLLPIISQYEFFSFICASFAITSWRNNRGAQESCLAINAAIADNKVWGNKKITSYTELKVLFDLLYPILQITQRDDPVLTDFGEIKLNYHSHYYSIITGTGHTQPIFAVLQFLESLSKSVIMDDFTLELLEYSDNMLRHLQGKNAPIDIDTVITCKFECPSEEYFKSTKDFLCAKSWERMSNELLEMLSTNRNPILKSHFYLFENNFYPLFNPSLVIDYFTDILSDCTEDVISIIVKETLFNKIYKIYNDKDFNGLFIENCLLVRQNKPLTNGCTCFVAQEDDNIIIFIESDDKNSSIISEIFSAFDNNELCIVDLDVILTSSNFKGYGIKNSANLHIICYEEHIGVDKPIIKLVSREERITYSAIDLMFMIMFSNSLKQILEFDNNNEDDASGVISLGGASDHYAVFIEEKGVISKGAIEYSNLFIHTDSAAAYIYNLYLNVYNLYPFHLQSNYLCDPECWIFTQIERKNCKLAKKPHQLIVGDMFMLNDNYTIFLSFDFKGILQGDNLQQIKYYFETCRTIVKLFFSEYEKDFLNVSYLKNKHLQLCCHSLTNQVTNSNYILHKSFFEIDEQIIVDFEVNGYKLLTDISNASNRQIEYNMILELLNPIFQKSETEFSTIIKNINDGKYKKKNVNTTIMRIEYFLNTNLYKIRETETSQLLIEKKIAKICAAANVTPGTYTSKDATARCEKSKKIWCIILKKKSLR